MGGRTTGIEEEYALGRSSAEYERLRRQARVWEEACGRALDQVRLGPGDSCLDAGCGPGETMRLMAQRVGPTGSVVGVDVDAALGASARAMLHGAGHTQCEVLQHDVTQERPLPGGPYHLVFARLLAFHLPQRSAVLGRLWAAVAPGGHLVVQEYDLRSIGTQPSLASVEEAVRVMTAAFVAVGADPEIGTRLPLLFEGAGIGAPDGTDVSGRLEPLATGRVVLEQTVRSLLPAAVAHGVTTAEAGAATLAALDRDAGTFGARSMTWPLLVTAWRRRPPV